MQTKRAGEVVCRCDGYWFPHRKWSLYCYHASVETAARRDPEAFEAMMRAMLIDKRERLVKIERGESDIGSGGRIYSSTGNRMGRY